jgi:hypothetical protein
MIRVCLGKCLGWLDYKDDSVRSLVFLAMIFCILYFFNLLQRNGWW